MEEKKVVHAGITGCLLVIAIIAVALEGVFIWKLNSEKKDDVKKFESYQQEINNLSKKNSELQNQIAELQNTLNKISGIVNNNENSENNSNNDNEEMFAESLINNNIQIIRNICSSYLSDIIRSHSTS